MADEIQRSRLSFTVGPLTYRVTLDRGMKGDRGFPGVLDVMFEITRVTSFKELSPTYKNGSNQAFGYGVGKDSRFTFKTLSHVAAAVQQGIENWRPTELGFIFLDSKHDRFWEKFTHHFLPGCSIERGKYDTEDYHWFVPLQAYYDKGSLENRNRETP